MLIFSRIDEMMATEEGLATRVSSDFVSCLQIGSMEREKKVCLEILFICSITWVGQIPGQHQKFGKTWADWEIVLSISKLLLSVCKRSQLSLFHFFFFKKDCVASMFYRMSDCSPWKSAFEILTLVGNI